MTKNELLSIAIDSAIKAGNAIMKIYAEDFNVEHKSDESPLTAADLAADKIIASDLAKTRIPIISEESIHASFEIRKQWTRAWIVDPLDGTKEFVSRNGEFTVNIALVDSGKPVMGVIFAPALQKLYFGSDELGAFEIRIENSIFSEEILKNATKIHCSSPIEEIVVVASRSHSNIATMEFIKNIPHNGKVIQTISTGSSLKFCLVASGKAHLYPRFGRTMEWDIAAGVAIVNAAKGRCVQVDGQELKFNKEDLSNPDFIVSFA